jgi:phosphoserine aminotransferase
MNVTFRCTEHSHEAAFLSFARDAGIQGLAGHRSVGGFRSSLYNGVTLADVETLVSVMQAFAP